MHWANRVWALPFLTALAPSERYYETKPRLHKKLTDWARQLLLQTKRWVGDRQIVAVSDSSYAVIDLLTALQGQVSLISRLRLDAALYEPVPIPLPGQRGRKRLKGARLPTLSKVADDKATAWQRLEVADWYGGQSQAVDYVTGTALCGAARAVSHGQKARSDPVGVDSAGEQADRLGQQRSKFESG